MNSNAQSSTPSDTVKASTPKLNTSKSEMDTEASMKYVGNQLWFQLRKRLHLTDEVEEKEQAKKEKAKKLSFFGIEIERE